ncbi:hypothetical protein [Micrococcus sp. TA1]|uniref:hypothetical protein n=1 Tax=Micrococcus sp. TA1 TaxID=681627 RepID=UPI0016102263|nr:hypothetical protein [Micrococcus sp. TA1]MBB5748559.1 hypothetical protein [Micrococcus sp. TA1]
MPWFRVDDNFYDHPKVDDLSLEAVGLWTLCGTYCAKQLTDGFVPARRAMKMGGTESAIAELIKSGLWLDVEGGYQFHDWDAYQPTREKVERDRESARERQARKRRNELGQYSAPLQLVSNGSHAVTSQELPAGSLSESHHPGPTLPDPSLSVPTRRKPERPLPGDWAPTPAHSRYAEDNGINLDFQAERFRNHAQANDRRARDWNAAFRNWLLKAEKSPTATKNPLWDT